ncbi:hypothetical protein C9374_003368 [Naegleria lovaniensis]|uniref:SWIM-type domain-containing protein n=1 Tax=Naegleria lovaniensis TaxID=51637 RepID=A0AA88KKA4_NAELO|nr:uncharacterized protein C9374_003368 [Naegleria lovaniensis]KAG2385553.1 hypothetical protein C9374_003368 [Naegleria lovaniensis]
MPSQSTSRNRHNYRQTNKSVSFSLDLDEENNNFDDFPFEEDKKHRLTQSPKFTFDDDEDSSMRDESVVVSSIPHLDSPRFDSEDDEDMCDDDHITPRAEDNLSQPLSQISSSEIADYSSIKVKTEIDELFEECEREKQEEDLSWKPRPSSDVKSPILFSSSVPTQVSSPILSSPVGLSQYQKEQRNVYQYEDIKQLTQPQSTTSKTENNDDPIDFDLTESQLESLQREDEKSTFHNFEPTDKTGSEVKVKQEAILENGHAPVQNSNENSNPISNNGVSTEAQELNTPATDANVIIMNNDNHAVTEDDDIDYSQIEAALREADEQEKLNHPQESVEEEYVSPMEQFRSKIPTQSSPSQHQQPRKQPLSKHPSSSKVKDEIQMSQESGLFPPPVIVDEIENSEGSQIGDSVKLSAPTKSPERPLTFREAVYKKHSHSPPGKPIVPDKELVAIKDQYGLIVFQRGNNYANEERIFEMNVETIEVEEGVELTFLTSKCWGTLEIPYTQSIIFDSKTMNLKKCKCSCPVEDHCKHTCACLITWLDCKKKSVPFPSLNSLGNRLEATLNELNDLRKEVERLRKENECLRDNYSTNSDDSMKGDGCSTPITKMLNQVRDGFVSSNSIEKTPNQLSSIFSSPISPSSVAESTDLKRKRSTFAQGERDPHIELGETCKKIHF